LKDGKYAGYIAYGHLVSSVNLHPDPNLSLWDFKIPSILSIMGFCDSKTLSSPKCISRHTILNSKKKLKKLKKIIDKDAILSNACKSEDKDSSLFEILLESLLSNKQFAIVRFDEKKYQFGYISTTKDNDRSGNLQRFAHFEALLFSLFEPNCDWLSHDIDAMLSHSIMDNFKSTTNILKDDKRFFKKSEESFNDYQFLPTVEDVPVCVKSN
jgi:hypothetical protein